MKKTIVTLIIVSVIAIVIAYRKPIGKFLAGEKTSDDKADKMHSKVKTAMIVAAEQVNEKAKKAAEALTAIEKKIEEKAAEEAQKADEKPVVPETPEVPEPDDDWFGGYDEDSRIVKAGGVLYNIPSVENMKSVQANLIEGFQFLADMAVTPSPFNPMTNPATELKDALPSDNRTFYRNLVEDMVEADTGNIPKTGIDGKMNRATAVAFAECVRIMPNVVAKYRIS